MKTIFPFDEVNTFRQNLSRHFEHGRIRSRRDCEDIIDELFELYLLTYERGEASVNESLSTDVSVTLDDVMETIDKEVAGETWRERVWDYFASGGTEADIVRIAETETHRIGNAAAYETATLAGAKQKKWVCMMLPTSRDTHTYLNGTTVGINDEFYTYLGNHAMYPGQFGVAEEDCNCLCELEFL